MYNLYETHPNFYKCYESESVKWVIQQATSDSV